MNRPTRRVVAATLPLGLLIAACHTAPRAPEANGVRPATRSGTPPAAASTARGTDQRRDYAEADVRFMQGMIAHHAQAVRMASLVPSRTDREDMHLLAQRIDVSQRDEIRLMQRWLQDRHETVPHPGLEYPPHTSDGTSATGAMPGMRMGTGHEALMPGMLTREQMGRLAAATGPGFDRLFLEGMIHHHEGALTMVATLFGTPGAAQESQIFEFATEVDAGQRAEIQRMRALLDALPGGAPRR